MNQKKPVPPPDLWELLDLEFQKTLPPKDAFTVAEYADRYKITYATADGIVKRLLKRGLIEFIGSFGSSHPQKYYGLKK